MIRNSKIFFIAAAVALWLSSCVKEVSMSGAEQEARSLAAWIRLHKPHLVENYQAEGGYYVEVLKWGDENLPAEGNDYGTEPLMDKDTCWVFTNMTGYSLDGNVCLTREPLLAEMNGTFSYNTHYVPYINYCGSTNLGLLEGTYLAMRHTLTLGSNYMAEYWSDRSGDFKMRCGSKVRLYMPSTIAYGETGSSVQGGYEGEYTLDANVPLIMDIEVKRAVKNPSDLELDLVKRYVDGMSDWRQVQTDEEVAEGEEPKYHTGLYINHNYNPLTADLSRCRYLKPEATDGLTNHSYKDTKKYASMDAIERKIAEVFAKRFPNPITPAEMTDENLVTKENNAKVWYVCRFLDGFILDTNIDELRQYCFDDYSDEGTAFSYRAKDDDNKNDNERKAIGAWYYCIPKLYFGQYAAIVTTSGYAYGVAGVSGSTTTTSSGDSMADYYAYMNYYNYYNYYYYGYGNYYNYYDYNSYNYGYATESVETTTISTEILPYTPLVFYLYVEPQQ